jgi:hypothetical protein
MGFHPHPLATEFTGMTEGTDPTRSGADNCPGMATITTARTAGSPWECPYLDHSEYAGDQPVHRNERERVNRDCHRLNWLG